ncbi:MAG TPA: dTMP kinase [Candidatus Syntrophoarchaeum butanivorans]|uniref:Probable thymidylate kinase n=1 Tax=Candidatus Syntropharchaeum butanivorans TaxID=1839936 RepID=A0A7C0X420_9EURY|nr:dTMP kinase [Candidatus Syntrophoarchaeum butanivorans]
MLIVFEGTDGSGLTTQSRLITEWLREKGYRVHLTKEPTTGVIGRLIREILRKKVRVTPQTLALLFAADRAEHTREIREWTEKGEIVISDRYRLSSFAYQSLKLDLDWIVAINAHSIAPDLTFVLETPAEVSLERIKRRNSENELFEDVDKLKRISENFRKAVKAGVEDNVIFIDGNRSIEEVFEEIKAEIEGRILPDGCDQDRRQSEVVNP